MNPPSRCIPVTEEGLAFNRLGLWTSKHAHWAREIATLRRIHISNAEQRNAVIVASSAKAAQGPVLGVNGEVAGLAVWQLQ